MEERQDYQYRSCDSGISIDPRHLDDRLRQAPLVLLAQDTAINGGKINYDSIAVSKSSIWKVGDTVVRLPAARCSCRKFCLPWLSAQQCTARKVAAVIFSNCMMNLRAVMTWKEAVASWCHWGQMQQEVTYTKTSRLDYQEALSTRTAELVVQKVCCNTRAHSASKSRCAFLMEKADIKDRSRFC